MDFDFSVLIIVASLLLGYFMFKKSSNNDYTLEALGIQHEKPWPFLGNMLPLFSGKEGGTQFMNRLYQTFKPEK
jgi:hypothetical protein